jgi:hypothetical protein
MGDSGSLGTSERFDLIHQYSFSMNKTTVCFVLGAIWTFVLFLSNKWSKSVEQEWLMSERNFYGFKRVDDTDHIILEDLLWGFSYRKVHLLTNLFVYPMCNYLSLWPNKRLELLKNLANELQVTYIKPNIIITVSVRIEWAGHLVRIVIGTYRKYYWGNQVEEEMQEDRNKGDQTLLKMTWSRWVSIDEGTKLKTDLYGLLLWRREWSKYYDSMQIKEEVVICDVNYTVSTCILIH